MAKKDMNLGNIREKKKQLNDFYKSAGKLSNEQVGSLKKQLSANDRIVLSNKEIEETIKNINNKQEESIKNAERMKVEQEAEYAILQKKLGLNDQMMSFYKGLNNYQKKLNQHQEKSLMSLRNINKMNLSEVFTNPLKAMDQFSTGIMNKVIDVTKTGIETLSKSGEELSNIFNSITGDLNNVGQVGSQQFDNINDKIVGLQPATQETQSSANGMINSIQTGLILMDTNAISKVQSGLTATQGTMATTGATGAAAGGKIVTGFRAAGRAVLGMGRALTASLAPLAYVLAPLLAIQVAIGGLVKMFQLMNKFNFGGMAGQFSAAMAQINHMWKIFEINIIDTLEPLEPMFSAIFGGIADIMVGFVSVVTDVFGGFFDGLVNSFGDVGNITDAFKKSFAAIEPMIKAIGNVLEPIFSVVGSIVGLLMQSLIPVFGIISAVVTPILNIIGALFKFIAWTIGLVIDGMNLWSDILYVLFKPLMKIGEIISDWIGDKWNAFVDGIKKFGRDFKTYISDPWDDAIRKVKEFISLIPGLELAKDKREKQMEGVTLEDKAQRERESYIIRREAKSAEASASRTINNNNTNRQNNNLTINNNLDSKKDLIKTVKKQNKEIEKSFFYMLAQKGMG